MDAHVSRVSRFATTFACTAFIFVAFTLSTNNTSLAQRQFRAESANFVVLAPDQNLARKAATLAEGYRKNLSVDWLGYEIEKWSEKCPIQIKVGPHAGGETSFAFIEGQAKSEPIGWRMQIFGPPDRLLDAVLPHEVTHTIFATHFGRPLPRWADEGACTTVEHESERKKNHRMLLEFLTSKPSRGIPLNRMFTMKRYPHDILPLYAQGYSVAKYLIAQKGRRTFIDFLEAGMASESSSHDTRAWDQVTKQFYGYKNLSDLQMNWIQWVRSGSNETIFKNETLVAANANNRVDSIASQIQIDKNPIRPIASHQHASPRADNMTRSDTQTVGHLSSWYARQSKKGTPQKLPAANATSLPTANRSSIAEDSKFVATENDFLPGSVRRANESRLESASQTLWR